jgi:hydroxyacylglutathione hydrolase
MLEVKGFVFSPFQENTYVIYNDNGQCCIVDPGCYFEEERNELKEFIDAKGLEPKYLLNTHCHLDHVFGAKFVYETWGLEMHFHEQDQIVMDYAEASAVKWNTPFLNYKGPVHYLKEGQILALGEDRLKVLFTPGHSPGHIAFYCEAQHFVISGDVIFKYGIGRHDFPGGSLVTLQKSIREQLYTLPDDVIIYCGHGPQTTIGHEKLNNPYVPA